MELELIKKKINEDTSYLQYHAHDYVEPVPLFVYIRRHCAPRP